MLVGISPTLSTTRLYRWASDPFTCLQQQQAVGGIYRDLVGKRCIGQSMPFSNRQPQTRRLCLARNASSGTTQKSFDSVQTAYSLVPRTTSKPLDTFTPSQTMMSSGELQTRSLVWSFLFPKSQSIRHIHSWLGLPYNTNLLLSYVFSLPATSHFIFLSSVSFLSFLYLLPSSI